jgi:hypothetical protein
LGIESIASLARKQMNSVVRSRQNNCWINLTAWRAEAQNGIDRMFELPHIRAT